MNEPGLGVGINPGMALIPFPSSIGWDSNPQPSNCESSLLTTRPDTDGLDGYAKGQVKQSVWLSFIYWCSIVTIQNMCVQEIEQEREREKGRERLKQWEGSTLIQVKGSRVSLLWNVHVHKLCMWYLKHTCEYKCEY
jgi:hypothetical protein